MPPSSAPVVITFSVEGVQALRGIFDSVEGAVDWIAGQTNSIRRFSPRT